MNIVEESGLLMLGTRLRRLGDRFLAEVSRVYKEQKIEFEPAWFPVFFALEQHGPLSLTELSVRLEVSHSAISQMVSQLQNKGLLETAANESDARIKLIRFSEKGQQLLEQLRRVWRALTETLGQTLPAEQQRLFLEHLALVEYRIGTGYLSERTLELLDAQPVELHCRIVPQEEKQNLPHWVLEQCSTNAAFEQQVVVAESYGEIIGFVVCQMENQPLLKSVFVPSEYRRQGIASAMLETLVKSIPARKFTHFTVQDPGLELLAFLLTTPYSFNVNRL